MNGAVFRTTLRESARSIAIVTLGLAAFFYLVLLSSSAFLDDIFAAPGFFRQPPKAIEAFLGGSANFLEPSGWLVTAMMHPVALALATVAAVGIAAGAVATELERGSLELVLARPVSRRAFLLGKLGASLVAVTAAQAGGVAGVLIARLTVDRVDEIAVADVLVTFLGAWLLFAAFAAVATFFSAGSSLRGRALAAGVGVIVASFFANFVALLFDEVGGLRYATPFHYFRPGELMEGSAVADLGVLLALGVLFTALAVRRFQRRDLTR